MIFIKESAICFSLQVETDLKKLCKIFNAGVSKSEFDRLYKLQKYEGITNPYILKELLGLKRKPSSCLFKLPDSENRIYPGYFSNVMISKNHKRIFLPMRYRVRPKGSLEEIPSKFNVFNARLDSLEKRKTWKSVFLKNHGLFPFIRFYEWVSDKNGKKKLISFYPKDYKLMWAPCLFDVWESKNKEIQFYSFAVITDDPPEEIRKMGHDRCPLFIQEENINLWLNAKSKDEAYYALGHTNIVTYQYKWAI